MARHVELALVVALLGVVLLLNPLYLYPDGGGSVAVTYEVEPIEDGDDALDAVLATEAVLTCPGQRACVFETRRVSEGPAEFGDRIGGEQRYDFVHLESGLYRTAHDYDGETARLWLEPASAEAALPELAVPASELPPAATEAAETGSVTVVGDRIEPLDRGAPIEHDGEYYATVATERRSHWTGERGLLIARLFAIVFGCGALLVAGGLLRSDAARSG